MFPKIISVRQGLQSDGYSKALTLFRSWHVDISAMASLYHKGLFALNHTARQRVVVMILQSDCRIALSMWVWEIVHLKMGKNIVKFRSCEEWFKVPR